MKITICRIDSISCGSITRRNTNTIRNRNASESSVESVRIAVFVLSVLNMNLRSGFSMNRCVGPIRNAMKNGEASENTFVMKLHMLLK